MFRWLKRKNPQDAMAQALLSAAQAAPHVDSIERVDALSFEVRLNGNADEPMRVNGHNWWPIWQEADSQDRQTVVDKVVASWSDGLNAEETDFDKVFIVARHADLVARLGKDKVRDGPWHRPLGGDLVLLAIEDMPNSTRTVPAAKIEEAGLDDATLLDRALANWTRMDPEVIADEIQDGLIAISVHGDAWLTGALLPMNGIDDVMRALGWSQAFLTFPEREVFYAVEAFAPNATRQICRTLLDDDLPYRQSDMVWRWTEDDGPVPMLEHTSDGRFVAVDPKAEMDVGFKVELHRLASDA